MVYKVIGLMSGSSLDGLDIVYAFLQEKPGTAKGPKNWEYTLVQTACYPYPEEWRQRLAAAPGLSALDYQLLHTEYGHYLGEQVLRFVEEFGLHYQVQLIGSHGHTAFHWPARKMTAQLGDGAALAATTRINVVSDLRAMDVALGGQGAPIVPIGEKLLLPGYDLFLNLGGIANLSRHGGDGAGGGVAGAGGGAGGTSASGAAGVSAGPAKGGFVAFDVCPAGRVLNALAAKAGQVFDEGGMLAAGGNIDEGLLQQLDALPYYSMDYPKSLANEFGTGTVLPMLQGLSVADGLRTYVEHIVHQVERAVRELVLDAEEERMGAGGVGAAAPGGGGAGTAGSGGAGAVSPGSANAGLRLLVTGGGAHNTFLAGRLREALSALGVELVIPDEQLINYKEALIMALIGVLRWREENNVLASVTGASRDSIGGAVWIGQEV